MNPTGHTLTQRVVALLQARQFLVYYAIVLNVVRTGSLLLGTWLATHEPLEKILEAPREPLGNSLAAPGVWTLGLFAVSVVVSAWLRAGYVRSLAGEFSLRPRDGLQFARLLVLLLVIAAVSAAANWAYESMATESAAASFIIGLLAFALGVVNIALLYADYVIVLGDEGPWTAVRLSARIAFGALMPSVLVVLAMGFVLQPLLLLPAGSVAQGLLATLPALVAQALVVGGISFVADIVLLVVFLDAVEKEAKTSSE